MMEFVATEAAFPVLPTHLIEGAAYSSLPAHPLGIRPLPASGNRFHDHHHHHHHGKHLKPHHHGDEEEDEEDSDDADEITKSVHPPEDEDGDGDGDDEENEDDDELEEDEDEEDECRKWGLGDFARLDDATVYLVLQQLPKEDLLTLSLVSRAFYAFAEEDQLWKAFILHRGKGNCDADVENFCYKGASPRSSMEAISQLGTWKRTVLMKKDRPVNKPYQPVSVHGMKSDLLYGWWYYANVDTMQWLQVHDENEIERRSGLTVQQFIDEYESQSKPVILTDVVPRWPAAKLWNKEDLLKRFSTVMFKTDSYNDDGEKITMSLANYFTYSELIKDEAPLYLFDNQFGEKAPALLEEYQVPEYFTEDLFSVLGAARPDYRWLIVGPPRSGSAFHQDPNRTAAWNALISGRKRWIMFPPHVLPPGVEKDENGNTLPIADSVIGWYLNYHEELQEERQAGKVDFIECMQYPGELIYVPEGWWHMVLNMEETIAVTQNFVSSQNLFDVYSFLHDNAETEYLFDPFVASMRAHSLKNAALIEAAEKRFRSCTAGYAGLKEFVRGTPNFCLTCDPEREKVCCRACAETCHEGHEVQKCAQEARFYCDCGAGDLLAAGGQDAAPQRCRAITPA